MKFEIVNPSDPYTMEADDMRTAAVVCCLLGEGTYMLKGLGDAKGQDVPPFLLNGMDQWFTEKFGGNFEATFDAIMATNAEALARSFESVKLEAANRSSMNDIGAMAKECAGAIRKMAAKKSAA